MAVAWNPEQYRLFGDHRGRPLRDLLARVPVEEPRQVVDLGCGPGTDTPALRRRWPGAAVLGLDSSPEMIDAARRAEQDPAVQYRRADVRDWLAEPAAGPAPEVVVSNAMLQWVPDHRGLLAPIADRVAPGGAFAFQVPDNFEAPSHALLREVAARHGYRGPHLRAQASPADYLEDLTRPGWTVDAWETEYQQVLEGEDPVFAWVSGTAARPVLDALAPDRREAFAEDCRSALREAYPRRAFGTVLPFRRIFVVAVRGEA